MFRIRFALFSALALATVVRGDEVPGLNGNLPPAADKVIRTFPSKPEQELILQPVPEPFPMAESPLQSSPGIPPVPDNAETVNTLPVETHQPLPNTPTPHNAETTLELLPESGPPDLGGQFPPLDFGASTPPVLRSPASRGVCGECCYSNRRCVADELCRMLTVYGGVAVMTRSTADPRQLFVNAGQPSQYIDAADFEFESQSGVEIGAIAHALFDVADLDVRFLSVGDIADSQRKFFSGNSAPIITPTQFSIPGPRIGDVEYASSMKSFEANVRYRYGGGSRWWTLIGGFRYLNVNESVSGRLSDPSLLLPTDTARIDVANHLYGFQVGADKTLFGDCTYSIDCYGRAGLYANDSSTSSQLQTATGPSFTVSGEGSQTSFVGELGVKASCRLGDCWNLYGRYQVLFAEDVAIASHQRNNQHSAHGEVVYHGAVFGLEYLY